VVAAGGIMRPEDATEKLDAGATLVQLYTGLIYAGPRLVADVCDALW
jgi:dihydroorotate dehydrogenase